MKKKKMKKKKRRRKPNIVNKHHTCYDPEIVAYIYQGEHMVLTHLERRTKNVSQSFIDELKLWIEKMEPYATDLTPEDNELPIWRPI